MQDAFREVLQDIIYRRWKLATCYWNSLWYYTVLYGDNLPEDIRQDIKEVEDLIHYLEADPLFNPNRNLQVQTCTLRSYT
jgi:hypothetical protein